VNMRRRSGALAFFALLLASLPAYAQENCYPSPNAIVTCVNMVAVGVTVTGPDGRFIDGLRSEDFTILDNGVEQQLAYFAVDHPTQVLLLIEAGPAVYLLEGGHLRAASGLLAGLSAEDEVAVARYAERPEIVSAFNTNKNVAAAALENLNFNLGFAELNLSASMAKVLDWLNKTSGAKTIVLLSSGVDTSPAAVTAGLVQRLRVGDVRVLAVSLAGELRGPTTVDKKKKTAAPTDAQRLVAEQFAVADQELRELAAVTGGRAYFPTNGKEFAAAYAEIAQIVRHEYVLGFVVATLDGKAHAIDVRVSLDGQQKTGVRVDHRQGYMSRRAEAP
jgi:Ca-activated chloride channel family protein